ncbi:hypothetical protein PHMEG_0004538 [Phytophthora megakarya]|uniref:Uncharacterized protein n=1 Tax=Phytophthora megakarya TaxID=4795 RepID=A0A225WTT2_9STRA|nr:hypothetical protein PHMEG_0004538 [Phytophthora megakarya]
MCQEPTDTPQPRGSRGPVSRGTARGRAGLGGRTRLDAPTSRHLALTGTDTEIPAPPSSTTISNPGDADDLSAPLSLMTIPGTGCVVDSGTILDEDLPAPNAVGSRELATWVNHCPCGGAIDCLVCFPHERRHQLGKCVHHPQRGTTRSCRTLGSRGNRPDAPEASGTKRDADTFAETPYDCRCFPEVAPALQPWDHVGSPASALRGPGAPVRDRPSSSLDESGTRSRATPGSLLPGPASLADEDLSPRKEGDRPTPPGNCIRWQPGTPLDRQFPERMPLPALALQVDLEELRFSGGAQDCSSVIATLQTMLYDAGYAFLNLVSTWGRTLSPELLAAQDGQFMSDASFLWGLLTVEQVAWNEIAQGRHYSVRRDDAPFQTLNPEVVSAFPVEEDGNALMLTFEEQELRGTAMVTRLRLAHVRPRDWSKSDTNRPEPKRRRGSADAPLSVPSWPGSDETTRVWGGPIPEVVGTSSLAFGDAPMLTPDENMPSTG